MDFIHEEILKFVPKEKLRRKKLNDLNFYFLLRKAAIEIFNFLNLFLFSLAIYFFVAEKEYLLSFFYGALILFNITLSLLSLIAFEIKIPHIQGSFATNNLRFHELGIDIIRNDGSIYFLNYRKFIKLCPVRIKTLTTEDEKQSLLIVTGSIVKPEVTLKMTPFRKQQLEETLTIN